MPDITYVITDGTFTSSARLLLTVEPFENLLEIQQLASCNQGFTSNGEYKIRYSAILTNRSNARDYHENSMIRNINLVNNLQNAFGNGCIVMVDNVSISNNNFLQDFVGAPYPREFTNGGY
ncbi:MAG: hypothetical protein HC798_04805 [Polaribacter sp.]|nr:hypothetical protein [Polaribacter sp.]